jgi:hypothetical protein
MTIDMHFKLNTHPLSLPLPLLLPLPFLAAIQHYEVIVEEVSDIGAAPTIAIATCSPLVPPPTCVLLNDYFRWHPDGKCKYSGNTSVLV